MHIWLHDRYSTHGTAVGYEGQNKNEIRLNETWILAYGPGMPPLRDITIASGGLVVNIEFPNHQRKDAEYLKNLRALINKIKEDEVPGVQGLGLISPAVTEPPSETQTTSERLIYFRQFEIGKGTFGRVFKLIRARDGKYLAGKVLVPPVTSKKRRRGDIDPTWIIGVRREYTLAKDNPHVSFTFLYLLFHAQALILIVALSPTLYR
jgi:hypothetical protein